MPSRRQTNLEVRERVDVGTRLSVGLIALSLSLVSLALGLAFISSPSPLLILAPTADIEVEASSATAVTLTWTAPGDDGNAGQAAAYDLRFSTAPLTESNFDSASPVQNEPAPQPAGSTESFTVTNLQPSTTYFFALTTRDEAGNTSTMSNVATKTTDALPAACVPTWECSAWSLCSGGTQSRTCTVTNGCDSNLGRPITEQACTVPPTTGTGGEPVSIRNPILAVGVGRGTVPVFRIFDPRTQRVQREILAYSRALKNGVQVAVGDIDADGEAEIVVGGGVGTDPVVKVFRPNGTLKIQFNPYPASRGIGVEVAVGDVDGDGVEEVLTMPARGPAQLRVFRYDAAGRRMNVVTQKFIYAQTQRNGFSISAGDLNLDGRDEVVIAARTYARTVSVVRLNESNQLTIISKFSPYPITFRTGITTAVADTNGDGRGEVVTTPGPEYYSHVKIFNLSGRLQSQFLPTSTTYRGGVDLAAFDVNSDGSEEILTGTFLTGAPNVWTFRYNTITKRFERIKTMSAYPQTMKSGLRLDAAPGI